MPSIVLRKIAQPQQISSRDILNTSTPLNYKDWLSQHVAIIPNDAQKQYEQYLLSFYTNKDDQATAKANNLKNDYIALIKKLSNIFKYDPEFQRYANIDLSSNTELKIAIPFYAKKLKEIAVYYINHRDNIKQSKLHYASIGSELGIERFLYKNLLGLFTKKEFSEDGLYSNNSPDLSAVAPSFKLEIEELYDTTNYANDNTLDINPPLCVLDGYVSNICTQLGDITTDSNNAPLESIFLCETDNLQSSDLIRAGWEKYLGTDLYYISGGGSLYNSIDVSLPIEANNNFFYWFSGENVNEIPEGRYNDIALSALDWSKATGSGNFSASDIIFVNYGNLKTEAAWLMSAANYTYDTEMTATISDGREFKFPYPGIGLSAEGGDWTGRLITDRYEEDKRFFPNEVSYQNNQKEIEKLYWSGTVTNSSVQPVNIRNLTLEQCGAYASNKFKTADKLLIRSNTAPYTIDDQNPNGVFTGNIDIVWLYKFKQTQLPVVVGDTNIYYPLTSFDNLSDLYYEYESGDTIALSSVPVNESFSGAIAGGDIATSDMIVKLKAPCGPEIEAAWLKGIPLKYSQNIFLNDYTCGVNQLTQYYTQWNYISGTTQPGIAFRTDQGEYVRFVWCGTDTDINNVKGFTGFIHDPSCEYTQLSHNNSIIDVNFLSVDDTERYERWKKCSCKSVYYSPLGHQGDNLSIKKVFPDFIVPDTQPDQAFNLVDWRGNDGKSYTESSDLIRFRPDHLIEKDIGWNKGRWIRPSNIPFILETGKSYIYYRTNLDSCNYSLPPFIINQGYSSSTIKTSDCSIIDSVPAWYKAVKNSNGEWIDTGLLSDMTLESGSFYTYSHKDSYVIAKQKLLYNGTDITPISGNYITVFNDDPNITYKKVVFSSPAINFLIKIPLLNNSSYWAQASYGDKAKPVQRITDDNRNVNEYLQLSQPIPSTLLLTEQNVIRYELSECNQCFTWKQPITLKIFDPKMRWNKISVDDCVYSDVLNYLHERADKYCNSYVPQCYSECQEFSICGCGDFCETSKTGVTATNIPADITLNTELSGIPVFINYFARNAFNLNFNVVDLTAGSVYHPPLSGLLSKAVKPWSNLLNDKTANFLYKQIDDNLMSHKQLGLMVPNKLGVGKYELSNAAQAKNVSVNGVSAVRLNKFDYPLTPTQIDSRKYKNNIGVPLLKGKQSYYPYTTGPNDLTNLSYDLLSWQNDIFGNQYYLTSNKLFSRSVVGNLSVKSPDGVLYSGQEYLAQIFNKYKAISFAGANEGIIITEDGYRLITEDGFLILVG